MTKIIKSISFFFFFCLILSGITRLMSLKLAAFHVRLILCWLMVSFFYENMACLQKELGPKVYTLFIKFPFTICPLKLRFNLHGVQALIRGHLTPSKHPHDLYLPSHTVVKVTVSLQHGSVNPFWWVTPSDCIKHLSPLTAVQNEVF